MQLAQCTELASKIDCQLKIKCRKAWVIKPAQEFWVTSPKYTNGAGCWINRKGRGFANSGIYFTNEQILQVFDVVQ